MPALPLPKRIALTFAAALALISLALASEHVGGLIPCALCLKQRVPYYLALPLLLLAYWHAPHGKAAARGLLSTVGVVFLAGAGLALYHVGIETGSWAGPTTCGGGNGISRSTGDLLEALRGGAMVRCDAPAWTLFGISLAGYNAIASLGLAALALGQTEPETANG